MPQSVIMKKRVLSAEHFKNKPIDWWPHEKKVPDDDYVLSKLKGPRPLKIIEIGPGRGRLTFQLQKLGHEIYAVEINSDFIKYCKKKDTDNISFYQGNVKELPFKDNTFDFAVLVEVLMHLPQPLDALTELNRVLKPGGKFITMFLRKYSKSYFISTYLVVTNRYKHTLDYRFHSWFEVKRLLKKSNFKILDTRNEKSGIPYVYSKKI